MQAPPRTGGVFYCAFVFPLRQLRRLGSFFRPISAPIPANLSVIRPRAIAAFALARFGQGRKGIAVKNLMGLAGVGFGGLFLASCVTYPYDTAFNSCEREANACYRLCEDIPDEGGYVACQRHCDRDIDRCFDQAYSPYSGSYYGSSYPSPWYGRYGSWYPNTGYYFTFNSYDRYGYRKNKRHHPRGDRDWRDRRDRDGDGRDWRDRRNDNPTTPTPPRNPDYVAPGGSSDGGARATPRRQRDGDRLIDQPRRPNRAYRNNSGPSGAAPGAASPPASSVPPPTTRTRQPRQTPPAGATPTPSAPQPTYTPPPADNSAPPSSERPARGARGNRSGGNSQTPDRDRE